MATNPRRIQRHVWKHKCWKEGVQLQISSASVNALQMRLPLNHACKHSFCTTGPHAWEFVWFQVVLEVAQGRARRTSDIEGHPHQVVQTLVLASGESAGV